MNKKDLASNLVDVRILLENFCDGFDSSCNSKNNVLTTKVKILQILKRDSKQSPKQLINKLGLAKSNLAILAKNLLDEGVIKKEKDDNDKRVIYYYITDKGFNHLQKSLDNIESQICGCKLPNDKCKKLNKKLEDIIKILNN